MILIKGVLEQGFGENICTQEVGENRRLKKMHNEKLYVLYFLSDIIRVIKLRRIR
jgi:hypothetical protein